MALFYDIGQSMDLPDITYMTYAIGNRASVNVEQLDETPVHMRLTMSPSKSPII